MLPTSAGVEPATSWSSVGWRIQLSHRGWHHEACWVMSDCDPEGRIFLSLPHTHDRFFFLHTIHFWKWVFDTAVTSIADVHHTVTTIPWRLVTSLRLVTSTLMMAYRDILYNQCKTHEILIFPKGWIRVCEIRFASTGVICGNPYPVCKKFQTSMAQTSLWPWIAIRYMGSSNYWGLFMMPGQEANDNNFGNFFPSFRQLWYVECTH